jgi:hypothetical protein
MSASGPSIRFHLYYTWPQKDRWSQPWVEVFNKIIIEQSLAHLEIKINLNFQFTNQGAKNMESQKFPQFHLLQTGSG